MSIISKETFDKFSEEEKKMIIDLKDNLTIQMEDGGDRYHYLVGCIDNLNALFGKENLQPEPKIKTWEDVMIEYPGYDYDIITINNLVSIDFLVATKIVATYKIAKLIELGYGGRVSKEEWKDIDYRKYTVDYCPTDKRQFIYADYCIGDYRFIAFHTPQQREEFMSYESNRKLVEQYYMT